MIPFGPGLGSPQVCVSCGPLLAAGARDRLGASWGPRPVSPLVSHIPTAATPRHALSLLCPHPCSPPGPGLAPEHQQGRKGGPALGGVCDPILWPFPIHSPRVLCPHTEEGSCQFGATGPAAGSQKLERPLTPADDLVLLPSEGRTPGKAMAGRTRGIQAELLLPPRAGPGRVGVRAGAPAGGRQHPVEERPAPDAVPSGWCCS